MRLAGLGLSFPLGMTEAEVQRGYVSYSKTHRAFYVQVKSGTQVSLCPQLFHRPLPGVPSTPSLRLWEVGIPRH